jgi:hypothetical protein
MNRTGYLGIGRSTYEKDGVLMNRTEYLGIGRSTYE